MSESRRGSTSIPVGAGKEKARRKRRLLGTACAVGVLACVAAFTAPLAAAARPQPYTATYTAGPWGISSEQTVGTDTRTEYWGTWTYTLTSGDATYAGDVAVTGQILVNANGAGPWEATDVLTGGSPCGSGTFTLHHEGFITDVAEGGDTSGLTVSAPGATDTVRIHLVGTWSSPLTPGNLAYLTGVLSCN